MGHHRAPGNWWRAEDRLAIAQEARNARSCEFCAERKAALSPFAVTGKHTVSTNLPEAAVDAVHRIVTDASRLSESWVKELAAIGISDGHYVELLGVVVSVVSIDGFHRAMGFELEPLPAPKIGFCFRQVRRLHAGYPSAVVFRTSRSVSSRFAALGCR